MLPGDFQKKKRKDMQKAPDNNSNKKRKLSEDAKSPEEVFKWLIHPVTVEDFYANYWEKAPLIISRNNPEYYSNPVLFTLDSLLNELEKKELFYGENIDIASYQKGVRKTLNREGERVTKADAEDFFHNKKCTLRILHPQEFTDSLFNTCSILQDWFGCVVGANVYITPPNSQGFAPHYDDVDVFILQVEGRKLWKLYDSITPEEVLPEVSSGNFEQNEIGKPFKEIWLEQGDILYFPRGVIHQAVTDKNVLSTHITVSTVQKWSWFHYLEKALPSALRIAFEENIEFRKTLPRLFQDYMGVMYSEDENEQRTKFMEQASVLATKALEYLPFDAAADQMIVEYLHDSLPPVFVPEPSSSKLTIKSQVRLVSKRSVRIACEGDSILFYFNTLNTRKYHETEPKYVEFPIEASPALEYLITSFPKFVSVESFPLEFDEDKIEVLKALNSVNLLLFDKN